MSIIYDALQKTQRNREIKSDASRLSPKSNSNQHTGKLVLASGVLLAAISFGYFSQIYFHPKINSANKLSQKISSPAIKPLTLAPNVPLVLNGIFISDNHKIAMINHHMYHAGDSVNNMKIVSISHKEVKLLNGDQTILLSSTL